MTYFPSKETYFKNVKEVFKKKFGHSHPLFTNDPQDAWFAALKLRFDSECACHAMLDPEVSVDRTSEPLYGDVTADASIIQAKYQGKVNVDVLSICMSMIKKGNESSVKALAELVLSRQGIERGGEHAFLCWNEGTWDPLFQAIDFNWAIIKQLVDHQCMLFFVTAAITNCVRTLHWRATL